jgi:predicted MFS family arabinose efflux permease
MSVYNISITLHTVCIFYYKTLLPVLSLGLHNTITDMDNEEIKNLSEDDKELTAYQKYIQSWKDMLKAPQQLWIICIIRFCFINSIFTVNASKAIFFSDVKNLSDHTLSLIFGLLGLASLISSMIFGNFPDRYGIKPSLLAGTMIITIKCFLLAIIENTNIQIAIFVLGSTGTTLTFTSLDKGLKISTGKNYRTLAISLFESSSYLASLLGGIYIQLSLTAGHKDSSTFRALFIYCGVASFVSFIFSFFLNRNDYEQNSEDESPDDINSRSGWAHTRSVIILKKFWRFFGVIGTITLFRIVFFNTSIVLPLYMERDLGNDDLYGVMLILNQTVVIIFTPIFSYSIYYLSGYDVFIITGALATIAPAPFLFGPSYFTIVSYVIICSIGESLLIPRVLEYALEIAPKGKEGVVLGITNAPYIIGITMTGILGGFLLGQYCPDTNGYKHCWKVWAIIMLLASQGFIILVAMRRWLEHKQIEIDPFMPCSYESKYE